jgi:uncharacterized membrane protein YdjX (TVP38/TMEM64 family)
VRPLRVRAAIGLCLVAIALALQLSPLRHLLSGDGAQRAHAAIDALGPLGPAAFLAVCALGIGIGLPRLGFAALGGLAFGWLAGGVLAQLGTVAGCFVNFGWARYFGRDFAQRGQSRLWTSIRERVARRPIATNVALRLVPVGNSLALNSLLGLCPISSRDFLIGTAIGTLPETLVFALFGSGISSGSPAKLATGAAILLALVVGSFALARRMRVEPELR